MGSHRPVLIKFATYGARKKVFKNRRYLEKQHVFLHEFQDDTAVNGDQVRGNNRSSVMKIWPRPDKICYRKLGPVREIRKLTIAVMMEEL